MLDKLKEPFPLLMKFLPPPPSPPTAEKLLNQQRPPPTVKFTYPNSPCPSPTPYFQQLYLAVANWDRLMTDSPDYMKEKSPLFRDFDDGRKLPILKRAQSEYHSDNIDTNENDSLKNRRNSLQVLSFDDITHLEQQRRKSSPADINKHDKDMKNQIRLGKKGYVFM